MITLTYEFKLIPSPEQVTIIEDMLAVITKVWNYALRQRKDWINSRKCAVNCCSLHQEYIIPGDTISATQAVNLNRKVWESPVIIFDLTVEDVKKCRLTLNQN